MKVIIDGVEYIPVKEAIANRDAIIRGLLKSYYGNLDETYDEDKMCRGIYVYVIDDPEFSRHRTVQQVIEDIAKFS